MDPESVAGASGPLSGVRVLDVSTILAGPLTCQILGDFGADVIKVEHPELADGLRGHGPIKDGVPLWWKEVGRNKRTVAVSLSDPEGADLLRRMVGTADVLVENFRPGTFERWGLAPEVLLELNPCLVMLRISGFGQRGPYAQRAGFGTLAEAMSGFAHLTGDPDRPPTLPAFGLADSFCGIAGVGAVTMALYERERSGRGQVIDLNLLEPLMTAVGPSPMAYQQLGQVEMRHGNRSMNNSPRNTYRTRDGKWVAVSTSAQRIAEKVLELVGHPEVVVEDWFRSGRTRADHADLLDSYVGSWIAERDREAVIEAFNAVGAAIAPVYDARDILEDEHIRATEMITEIEDEELGRLAMHNVMWRMSATPGAIRYTGRALGADTEEILDELHVPADTRARLRRRGVIA